MSDKRKLYLSMEGYVTLISEGKAIGEKEF